MLKVGIHDNLVIKSTTKNTQGTLEIVVKKMTEINPLDALNSSGQTNFIAEENKFLVYGPKTTSYNNVPLKHTDMLGLIAEVKDPLDHIASAYLPETKRKWDMWLNTGVTKDNLTTKLMEQTTVDKIYGNIVDQFIAMMTPFVGEAPSIKRVRMIFPRKSPTSNFPRLRTRFLGNQPFIEPMDVPTSKLEFSKYEKEKGLDNPNPVGGEQKVDKKEAEQANSLFAK